MAANEENILLKHDPAFHNVDPSQASSQDVLLLHAARGGNDQVLQSLLDKGASLRTKADDDQTALHLAVRNGHESSARILVEAGADLEAADTDGNKALYVAAKSGSLAVAGLLLRHNANVESFNPLSGLTAFYQATLHGHIAVAKVLREYGADIDTLSPGGQSPLFSAVAREDLALVEFLLQSGANRGTCIEDYSTVEDIVSEGTPMMELLCSGHILQGRPTTEPEPTTELKYTVPTLGAGEVHKVSSCHGFQATIVDFFLGETEQRIQKTASIYEILYGRGPESIMRAAMGTKLEAKQRTFRWYHLPANNMEWVDILASRHFGERSVDPMILDEKLKGKLALSRFTSQQYRVSTTETSYMRPQCRTVESNPEFSLGNEKASQLVLFIPFLHFETYKGYRRMIALMEGERTRAIRESRPQNAQLRMSRHSRRSEESSTPPPPSEEYSSQVASSHEDVEDIGTSKKMIGRRGDLGSTLRDMRKKVTSSSDHTARASGHPQFQQEDLEKGTKAGDGVKSDEDIPVIKGLSTLSASNNKEKTVEGRTNELAVMTVEDRDAPKLFQKERGTKRSEANFAQTETSKIFQKQVMDTPRVEKDNTAIVTHTSEEVKLKKTDTGPSQSPGDQHALNLKPLAVVPTGQKFEENVDRRSINSSPSKDTENKGNISGVLDRANSKPLGNALRPADTAGKSQTKSRPGRIQVPQDKLNECLIRGYLSPENPGESPLQLRRTLDQYFYTHLADTSGRDHNQAVYRYTKLNSKEAKLFMVDQLWIWILNDDTIISCCPQRVDLLPKSNKKMDVPVPVLADGQSSSSRNGYPRQPSEIHRGTSFPPLTIKVNGSDPALPSLPSIRRRSSETPESPTSEITPSDFVQVSLPTVPPVLTRPPALPGTLKKGKPRWPNSQDTSSPLKPTDKKAGNAQPDDVLDSQPSTVEEKRERRACLQHDPLNVHQSILRYLQSPNRVPITSINELGMLITKSCITLFDQNRVPNDYQFFDFFERHIGVIFDEVAKCFQLFAQSLDEKSSDNKVVASKSLDGIITETKLLTEIKHIRDELEILQMILTDQLKPSEDFAKIAMKGDGSDMENARVVALLKAQNTVIESHFFRIKKMERLAKKSYKALNHLLDLKQKQANVSETLSDRIQAEQVQIRTIRQERTVLGFTIITIVFLPLSFMAAFLTISIDSFPFNESGRLSLNFALTNILSVSGAISIPLILIALNQDRIVEFVKKRKTATLVWASFLLGTVALLSVIWTRHLASGIKVALTITITLLVITGLFIQGIYWLHSSRSTPGWKGNFNDSVSSVLSG